MPPATPTAPTVPAPTREYAYDPASRLMVLAKPGHIVTSSMAAGWTSLVLTVNERDGTGTRDATECETHPTSDQALVITLGGEYELECFVGGVWRRAVRQPGIAGLTPGGMTNRIRWRSRTRAPIRTLDLCLPAAVVDEARDEFRRAGAPHRAEPLNAPAFRDPIVTHALAGLVRAIKSGAPDLYAATTAHYLAVHLLARHTPGRGLDADERAVGPITDQRLARVVEYMSAHVHESLTLECLAREAAISKFHFARLFRAATGETPHAFLVRLRMQAARQMLRDTNLNVTEVAAAVGYTDAAHFTRVFARAGGRSPSAYRTAARRG